MPCPHPVWKEPRSQNTSTLQDGSYRRCSGRDGMLPTESKGQKGKTAASCSDPTAIPGKRHLNPASLEGNSCQRGEACPGTPLLRSGAKKNMCCENRCCDSHTCELSFAQPSSPQGALPATWPIPLQHPGLGSPPWFLQRAWPRRILSFSSLQPLENFKPPSAVISINYGCATQSLLYQDTLIASFSVLSSAVLPAESPVSSPHVLCPTDTPGPWGSLSSLSLAILLLSFPTLPFDIALKRILCSQQIHSYPHTNPSFPIPTISSLDDRKLLRLEPKPSLANTSKQPLRPPGRLFQLYQLSVLKQCWQQILAVIFKDSKASSVTQPLIFQVINPEHLRMSPHVHILQTGVPTVNDSKSTPSHHHKKPKSKPCCATA